MLSTPIHAADVPLIWDPNVEEIAYVAGYKIYYGYSAGIYETSIDVNNQTAYLVTGLAEGATYFFAVTAYDSDGYETPYSNEISYTVPLSSAAADEPSDDGGSTSGGGGSGSGGSSTAADDTPAAEPQCTADAECDDSLFCNGLETCQNNLCVPGAPPCTDGELCDDHLDSCRGSECETASDCDDDAFCNGAETCNNGYCIPGTPPCAADEGCDEATDSCQNNADDAAPDGDGPVGDDDPADDGTGDQHTLSATCLTQEIWRPPLMSWRFAWLILFPEHDFYFNDANYVIRITNPLGNADGIEFDIARKPTQYFNFILIPIALSRDAAQGQYTVMIKSYPVDDTLVAYFIVR